MADKQNGFDLSNEAEIYIRLGTLLQKPRAADVQKAVQLIVNNPGTPAEKIQKITELDAAEEAKKKFSAPVKPREHPEDEGIVDLQEILKRKNLISKEIAEKNANKIMAVYSTSTFLNYFFGNRSKLRDFGNRTGLLKAGIFNIQLTIRKASFISIQRDAAALSPYLTFLLETAWMNLEKPEYNLLAQLKQLCDDIQALNLSALPLTIDILDKIVLVETHFLVCHYHPDYPDNLISTIRLMMKGFQKPQDKIDHAVLLTERLLKPGLDVQTLPYLILAASMVKYKKYLEIKNLVAEIPPVISNYIFECPDNVRARIQTYATDLEKHMKDLLASRAEISATLEFLRHFLPEDTIMKTEEQGSQEHYQTGVLAEFYDSGTEKEKFSFNRERDNLPIFCQHLCDRFQLEFEGFLTGRVKTEGNLSIPFFTTDFFKMDLIKLQAFRQKIAGATYTLPVMPRAQFLTLKNNPANGSRDELAMIQLIDEISSTLGELAKKAGKLSLSLNKDDAVSEPPLPFRPIDPSALIQPAYSFPARHYKIIDSGYLHGKSYEDAVYSIAALGFMSAAYLLNHKLLHLLDKVSQLTEEIKKTKNQIERIADPLSFEKMRKSLNI